MTELNDQGKEIEVTTPLHSREWCEAVWPELIDVIFNASMKWFDTCNYANTTPTASSWYMGQAKAFVTVVSKVVVRHRIHPNSEQFNGIMAGCSEEFREAVRSKMNG